jgi:predicted permease
VTSLAAGILPLLYTRRLDVARALSQSTLASAGAGRSRVALTRLLVVSSQVAVTVVLVVGAILLSRSFLARASADRGYDPSNVITATVPFPVGYSFEQRQQAWARIIDRVKAYPGITHAAFSTGVPLISAGGFTAFTFASPLRDGVTVEAESIRRIVTPDYFGALDVRVRAGRPITDRDVLGSPTAIVVNRSFVRKYLDDVPIERAIGLAIGEKAVAGTQFDGPATIVGVVDDLRQDAVDAAPQPEMFVAVAQLKESAQGSSSIVIVRTVDDPSAYVGTLRNVVREIDPSIALDGVMTMEQRVNDSVSKPRTYALLLGGFALFAVVIAGTGLFGVLSHSVTQRSRELAVRSALGASRAAVVRTALAQVAGALLGGLGIGLAIALAMSGQLEPLVFGVSPRDWLSFAVASLVLLCMGALACVVPARRVAHTDPVEVLREI